MGSEAVAAIPFLEKGRFLGEAGLVKKRVDLITLDCTFLWDKTEPNARHMGLDEVSCTVGKLERAGVADENTKKVITHFSHNSSPTMEAVARAEREFGFIAAYDGMTLEI